MGARDQPRTCRFAAWATAGGLLLAAGCTSGVEQPAPGDVVWEHELSVEAMPRAACTSLVIDPGSDAIFFQAAGALYGRTPGGDARWMAAAADCRQVWLADDDTLGSMDQRFDLDGAELQRYQTGLGRFAAAGLDGEVFSLDDDVTKSTATRTERWRQPLLFELGTPRAAALAVDSQGHAVIAWAGMNIEDCPSAYLLRKYDEQGKVRWSQCLPVEQNEGAALLAIDADDDILIVGKQAGQGPDDGSPKTWELARYHADGQLTWVRELATLTTSRDGAADRLRSPLSALVIDHERNVVVVGRVLGRTPELTQGLWIKKVSPQADERWTTTLVRGADQNDEALAVAVDSTDHVVVLAQVDTPPDAPRASSRRLWLGSLVP